MSDPDEDSLAFDLLLFLLLLIGVLYARKRKESDDED